MPAAANATTAGASLNLETLFIQAINEYGINLILFLVSYCLFLAVLSRWSTVVRIS